MTNQTRRVYRFHETVPLTRCALRDRSPRALRALLTRVWERYGRGEAPTVRFRLAGDTSQVTIWGGHYEIHLTRPHQNFSTLLHEIAHCLHPRERVEHGPRFVATYIKLMDEFARMPEEELLINASLYGIRVHDFS